MSTPKISVEVTSGEQHQQDPTSATNSSKASQSRLTHPPADDDDSHHSNDTGEAESSAELSTASESLQAATECNASREASAHSLREIAAAAPSSPKRELETPRKSKHALADESTSLLSQTEMSVTASAVLAPVGVPSVSQMSVNHDSLLDTTCYHSRWREARLHEAIRFVFLGIPFNLTVQTVIFFLLLIGPAIWAIVVTYVEPLPSRLYFDGCKVLNNGTSPPHPDNRSSTPDIFDCIACNENLPYVDPNYAQLQSDSANGWYRTLGIHSTLYSESAILLAYGAALLLVDIVVGLAVVVWRTRMIKLELLAWGVFVLQPTGAERNIHLLIIAVFPIYVGLANWVFTMQLFSVVDHVALRGGGGDTSNNTAACSNGTVLLASFSPGNPQVIRASGNGFEAFKSLLVVVLPILPFAFKCFVMFMSPYAMVNVGKLMKENAEGIPLLQPRLTISHDEFKRALLGRSTKRCWLRYAVVYQAWYHRKLWYFQTNKTLAKRSAAALGLGFSQDD